jgi:hypothetical protein
MHPFLKKLQEGPLLFDGGMGTLLYARGASSEQCLEELVITRPGWVMEIHQSYAAAGADILKTHTFGANRLRLERYGLGDRVREFNFTAVRLVRDVREVAGRFPGHLAFGLPNDSGIAASQGFLPSGNKWQLLQFIIDNSWDLAEDQVHIKTRQGIGIEHIYHDGRKWIFHGGDALFRIFSPDYTYQGTWIIAPDQSSVIDYWNQSPSRYASIEHIMSEH